MSKFKSPNPVGPYSMFRKLSSGGWITSGQIPIDPETRRRCDEGEPVALLDASESAVSAAFEQAAQALPVAINQ